jgi:hypothetical protein
MMQYQESYAQFDTGLLDLIKKSIPVSFANGAGLEFPQDREIELKLKYEVTEEGGAFSLKFSWDNDLGEEEEEEDDADED